MKDEEKELITQALRVYAERNGGGEKAANKIGISGATISNLLNGKANNVSDRMYRKISVAIGYGSKTWVGVETSDFKILTKLMNDAQVSSNALAIVGDAGTGKTYTMKHFARHNTNVYMLKCAEYWTKKMFVSALCAEMGMSPSGSTIGEMMEEIVTELQKQDKPLILIDEADKLSDTVLYFFISLYNRLEDESGMLKVGLILCATDHLKKMILRGKKLEKRGYKEIYSRVGSKFIALRGVSASDVSAICYANGLESNEEVELVIKNCESDLRRVQRSVHAIKNDVQ